MEAVRGDAGANPHQNSVPGARLGSRAVWAVTNPARSPQIALLPPPGRSMARAPWRMVPCATRWPAGLVCLALGLAGCARDGRDAFAFRNPFDTDRGPDTAKLPAASTRAATRVNAVGSEVAAKNKDALGVKPVFFTMGVPEVEISHHKSGMVILSEGLVERCPTDAELAAVICHELGKLAAEQRGAGRGPRPRRPAVHPGRGRRALRPGHDAAGRGGEI